MKKGDKVGLGACKGHHEFPMVEGGESGAIRGQTTTPATQARVDDDAIEAHQLVAGPAIGRIAGLIGPTPAAAAAPARTPHPPAPRVGLCINTPLPQQSNSKPNTTGDEPAPSSAQESARQNKKAAPKAITASGKKKGGNHFMDSSESIDAYHLMEPEDLHLLCEETH